MNKPELLAPAGNLEKLKTAIDFGADAVYLGGNKLSLRAFADNFSSEDLLEGLNYCHDRGKKVYVTVNVIPHNNDLIGLEEYLSELYTLGVDAIIVSDPGIISIAKETVPNLELHLSTQANTVNWKSAEFWYKQGIKRVVLAREMSIEEIKDIRSKLHINCEIEAFVHGAMCMSYSGRCVLSNYMTGRDSNRGQCAQPCRYKYYLMEEKRPGEYFPIIEDNKGTYILNSKDLCMIEHIPELIKCGIDSFKIEGRMKSSYYVASIVKAYRMAIDEYFKNPEGYVFKEKWLNTLLKASHRKYFTGFYFNDPSTQIFENSSYIRDYDIVGIVKKYDKLNERAMVEQRNKLFEGDLVEVLRPFSDEFTIKIDDLRNLENEKIESAPVAQMIFNFISKEVLLPGDMLIKEKTASPYKTPYHGQKLSIMRCFNMNKYMQNKRIWILFTFIFILFSILFVRIFQFQFLSSKKLSVMADAQYSYRENIESLNFKLLDRNGKNLISSINKYYVVIVPNDFKSNDFNTNSENILTLVYTLRNYNNDYDIPKLNLSNKGQKMYLEVDKSTYDKVKNIKSLKGVYAYTLSEMENKGSWSIESLLVNPRRLFDDSFKSEDSLELKLYNKVKNNDKTQIVFEKDTAGNITSENIKYPENNINVRLTIDKNIQQKISEVLQGTKYKNFKQIGVIMMEASTGKILGMVQKDNLLPNVNIGAATDNGFYPGSIFKVIVEEAALSNNSISLPDKFTCRGLYEDEHKNHGTLNSSEALVVSCNDIYAQIGNKTGYKAIYSLAEQQGMFSKVLGLDSELAGKTEIAEPKLSDGSISLVSMGQGMRITPIEAISISNTVANGGVYVKPKLIDAYVDGKNNSEEKTSIEKKNVLDKNVALSIKNQMIKVVEDGTAKGSTLNGFEIGGKTGTTQRNQFSDGWFTGFFKVNDKSYSMIVFVEDINKLTESGGNTAAPIFRDVVSETKDILNN